MALDIDLITQVRDLAELLHAPPFPEQNLDPEKIGTLMRRIGEAHPEDLEKALRLIWWPVGAQPVNQA